MNLRENRQTEQSRHHKLKLMVCDALLLLFVVLEVYNLSYLNVLTI